MRRASQVSSKRRVETNRSAIPVGILALMLVSLVLFVTLGPVDQVARAAVPPYAWSVSRVDPNDDTGLFTSIVLDGSGEPYISYIDETLGIVRVAHRSTSNWTTEPVASVGSSQGNTNLAFGPNATLYLSFVAGESHVVELATRNASGWTVTPVDLGYSEGYNRLVIDPTGRPMLSYTASNGWLRYAVRTGTTWAFETVDRTTVISRYIGLAVDGSGEPHISYYGNGVLRYAARVAGVWQTEMVDPSPYAGWYSTIGLDSGGAPHIAYYDSVNTTLRYAERVNGTWAISTIDGNDDAGWDASLAIDRFDRVHVAYYARLVGELRYAIRTPAGWIRETADTGGVVGWYISLAADRGGLPRIAYYDWTNGDLKYTEGAIALSVRTHRPLQTSVPRTTLEGEIVSLGTHASAETRFAIRPAGTTTWNYTAPQVTDHAGRFTVTISNLTAGQRYEYRADAQSGNESATGDVVAFVVPLPLQPAPPYLLFIVGGLGAAAFVVIAIWFFCRKRRAGRVPIIEPGGTRPSVPAAVRGTPDRRHRRGRPSRWDTGDGSDIRTAGPRGLAVHQEALLGASDGSPDPGQGSPSSVPSCTDATARGGRRRRLPPRPAFLRT